MTWSNFEKPPASLAAVRSMRSSCARSPKGSPA